MKRTGILFVLLVFSMSLVWGADHWTESFENPDSWSGYTTGTVNFDSGDWDFVSVYPETSTNSYNGSKACRINDDVAGASITAPAVNSVGTVTFYYHRPYSGTGTFSLKKSVDGAAFTELTTQNFDDVTDPTLFTFDVNDTSDNIRIRIENDDNSAHLTIDYVTLTDYVGGGPIPPSISNIVQTPDVDITSSTTVSVSAEVTAGDAAIDYVELHYGTTSGSLTNTIAMSLDAGDTYETNSDIPGHPDGTTVYYEIYAIDVDTEDATSLEQNYTVSDPATATLPYSQEFETDLGDVYTYNSDGAQEWDWTSFGNPGGSADVSGYSGGAQENVDWMITPEFDFTSIPNARLYFDEAINYGTGNIADEQEVYVSTDYTGLGDPDAANWTELTVTNRASGSSWDYVTVDEIDLSDYSGESSVHFGFKYTSTTSGAATWQVDNINVYDAASPQITVVPEALTGFNYVVGEGPSAEQSFTISGENLTDDITITPPTNYEISTDTGGSFVATDPITLSPTGGSVAETTIYVRLEAGLDEGIYENEDITASSTDAEDKIVTCSGSVTAAGMMPPTAGIVFISEVCDDNGGGYMTAYMEIFNNSDDTINMEGAEIQRWDDGSYDGYTYTLGAGVTIPPNGILIVARGADQSTFETAWGIDISTMNATFDQGHTNLYLTTGRSYQLHFTSRALIDDTPEVDSGNRIYQITDGNWSAQESSSNGSPGNLDPDQPLPITLSAFTATYVQNNFVVYVSWTTESESAMNCYNLYRAEAENGAQMEVYSVNATNTTQTHTYQFEDTEISAETTYYYWLEAVGNDGTTQQYGPTSVTIEGEEIPELPTQTYLHGNFPNPFNPETVIKFDVKENDTAKLTIYNIKGEEVMQKTFQPGEHEFTWDATVSSGVYFYKLTSETYTRTKKMLLLK